MTVATIRKCDWRVKRSCRRPLPNLPDLGHEFAGCEGSPPPDSESPDTLPPVSRGNVDRLCRVLAGGVCDFPPSPPCYDERLGELRIRRKLLVRLAPRATNQGAILLAFQKATWPRWIPDPLPNDGRRGRQRRLHDAVYQLNI